MISAIAEQAKEYGELYDINGEAWIYAYLPPIALRDVIVEVARRNSVDMDAVTVGMIDEQFDPFRVRVM